MPAPVVLVHDDPQYLSDAESALRQAGFDVAAISDAFVALKALETANRADLLITPLRMPDGMPNGVSLALMAKRRRRKSTFCSWLNRKWRNTQPMSGSFLPPRSLQPLIWWPRWPDLRCAELVLSKHSPGIRPDARQLPGDAVSLAEGPPRSPDRVSTASFRPSGAPRTPAETAPSGLSNSLSTAANTPTPCHRRSERLSRRAGPASMCRSPR